MPRICETVTTPVPPMPGMRSVESSRGTAARASGSSAGGAGALLGALARDDLEERRAVALDARVVLVARRLVDLRLAAELGLDRQHGQARGLLAAVAAALAHALVDVDRACGVGELAALAQRGASRPRTLVVDQDGDALDLRELRLRARARRAGAPRRSVELDALVPLGLVGGDDDPLDALEREPARQLGDLQPPSTSWPPVIATVPL